jgi:phosphoglycolate phosphatase
MASIRAILFDKDGTLLDFHASWSRAYRELAMELCGGDEARACAMLEAGGMNAATGHVVGGSVLAAGNTVDIVNHWFPNLARAAHRTMVERFDAIFYRNGVSFSAPVAGAPETLAALAERRILMGVGTSDSTAGSKATFERLGLATYLPHVFGYDSVARPKPAPDIVLAFADAVSVPAAEIAVVGDNTHDLEMAHAAEAGAAIAVLSGNGTREQLEPLADAVLNSVCELPAWLDSRP